jgi:hydrogenase 3 maturation protease
MGLESTMAQLARGRTCIVGMGNYLRRDDAVGLYVVDAMKERMGGGVGTLFHVEEVLENHVWSIAEGDAENVILVDAVASEAGPGSVFLEPLAEDEEIGADCCTHKLSLALARKVLAWHHKKVWLLGIGAGDAGFGSGLTPEVRRSADLIWRLLLRHFGPEQREGEHER